MLKNTVAGNFVFYILIYFFPILNSLLAAPPKPVVFTYGIDRNIKIKGFSSEEISECVRIARKNWEESGYVKIQYSRTPDVIITSDFFTTKYDMVGYYDYSKKRIFIESDPIKRYNHFQWSKRTLSHCLTHEFGHFFGLQHSSDKNSIMQPKICGIDKPSSDDFQSLRSVLINRKYQR